MSAVVRRMLDACRNFLIVSVPTMVLCLLVVEVPLSIAGYGRLEIYEPDPTVFWRLRPNQDGLTKVDRKPFHINSHGTRGREFFIDKPADTIRILSLGDSRTFGWGLADDESYSARLERELGRRVGVGPRIEVINAGVNAWSYPQLSAYFSHDGVEYQPDYVVVGEANNWTQFVEGTDPSFARRFAWSVRLKNVLRRFAVYHYIIEVKLESFYQKYRRKFIPLEAGNDPLHPQQQRDPDTVFRKALTDLCRVAQSRGVKPVLLYLPLEGELATGRRAPIYQIKAAIAQELGIPFVDVTEALKAEGAKLYLDADPVHLNVDGNRVIAATLAGALERMIAETRDQRRLTADQAASR